jgi:hypothetical protein
LLLNSCFANDLDLKFQVSQYLGLFLVLSGLLDGNLRCNLPLLFLAFTLLLGFPLFARTFFRA